MPKTIQAPPQNDTVEKKKKKRRFVASWLPGRYMRIAAVPTALAVYYMCYVAPDVIPVPEGVTVPYPAATRFLEGVCAWCGNHALVVVLVGVGLLLPGVLFRLQATRYYLWLTVLMSLFLGFTYLSISAPIDRLLHTVKENLPEKRTVPDYLPRGGQR